MWCGVGGCPDECVCVVAMFVLDTYMYSMIVVWCARVSRPAVVSVCVCGVDECVCVVWAGVLTCSGECVCVVWAGVPMSVCVWCGVGGCPDECVVAMFVLDTYMYSMIVFAA